MPDSRPLSSLSPAVVVRLATADDLPALAPLFDAYRQFYEQAPDLLRAHDFLAQRLARQDSVILLAEDMSSAQALGFCQLYPSFCSLAAAPFQILSDLFVAPAGRRRGVGGQLLQAARGQAQAAGLCRLELTTARTNQTAQSLYTAMGWQRDEVYLTFVLPLVS